LKGGRGGFTSSGLKKKVLISGRRREEEKGRKKNRGGGKKGRGGREGTKADAGSYYAGRRLKSQKGYLFLRE